MLEDDLSPKQVEAITAYLKENLLHQLWRTTPFHSWPCAVWNTQERLNWEDFRDHGLIPPHIYLVTDDDDDVV